MSLTTTTRGQLFQSYSNGSELQQTTATFDWNLVHFLPLLKSNFILKPCNPLVSVLSHLLLVRNKFEAMKTFGTSQVLLSVQSFNSFRYSFTVFVSEISQFVDGQQLHIVSQTDELWFSLRCHQMQFTLGNDVYKLFD